MYERRLIAAQLFECGWMLLGLGIFLLASTAVRRRRERE